MIKNFLRLIVLVLLFMIMPFQTSQAYGEVESPLRFEVSTDKEAYQTNDEIQYRIDVTNHSEFDLDDVLLSVDLPKELEVIESETEINADNQLIWQIESLARTEQVTIKFATKLIVNTTEVPVIEVDFDDSSDLKSDSPNLEKDLPDLESSSTETTELTAPKTGDDTTITKYIMIFILSVTSLVVAFFIYRKKKTLKATTVGLLLIGLLIVPNQVVNAVAHRYQFTETSSIQIGDQEYALTFTVEGQLKGDLMVTGAWEMDDEADLLNWKLSWTPANEAKTYLVYRSFTNKTDDFELIAENVTGDHFYATDFFIDAKVYYYIAVSDEDVQSNTIVADGTIDSDQDELVDAMEYMIGTDPFNPDTDGDGLPDGYEKFILGSDPLKIDSNNNGVSDGDEDEDSDGLTNLEEYQLGTDPLLADTDFDGLTDGEEVNTYQTDPLKEDTDEDGLLDGYEIQFGTDPLNPDSNGNGILDGDELYEFTTEPNESDQDPNVSPSITMEMEGSDLGDISISRISGDDPFLNKNIPGYIGSAYNFLTDTEFGEATMTFAYDDSVVTENFEPAIFYYNVEEQRLDRLEDQTHDDTNNTVSVQVEHFSSYILLNAYAWDQLWKEEVAPPIFDEEGQAKYIDVVLSIDSSGSMGWEDPDDIRKTAAKAFVDKLREEDRAAVVDFDLRADLLVELTNDKSKVHYAIDVIDSSGGTNLNLGLTRAITEIKENGKEEHLKYVIFLTDGAGSVRDSTIDEAKEHNVVVYTIGLGKGVNDALLQRIATNTGGKYFPAENADQLKEIFEQTALDTIDRLKDTDEDGIPDYLEKTGMRLGNGTIIQPKKDDGPGLDFENPDSDGDGLLDGQEIDIHFKKNQEGKVYYTYHSDPTKVDSDGDGLVDAYLDSEGKVVEVDPQPLEYNITDRTLALIAGLSYNNLSSHLYKNLGAVIDSGYKFINIEAADLESLRDWTIVQANDSGMGYWADFWDKGLGNVSLKYTKSDGKAMVVYGLRGTEFDDDILNDGATDVKLAVGKDSKQSQSAYREYKLLASKNRHANIYLTGHSLGGRLVQDVNYKVANTTLLNPFLNYLKPTYSATFNALGYNIKTYLISLSPIIHAQLQSKINNYYYNKDTVGQILGNSPLFQRIGKDIGPWTARNKNGQIIEVFGTSVSKVHGIQLFHYDKNLIYPNVNLIE